MQRKHEVLAAASSCKKQESRYKSLPIRAAIAALVSVLGAGSHVVEGSTWSGGGTSNDWTDLGNWIDAVPVSSNNTSVIFAGTQGLTPVNSEPYALNSLTFDSTAGAFVLGGNTLTFSNDFNSNPPSITQNASAGVRVNNPILFNNNLIVNTNGTGSLTLAGSLAGSGQFTKSGAGTLVLDGAISNTGGASFNAGLTQLLSTASISANGALVNDSVGDGAELDVEGATIGSLANPLGTLTVGTSANSTAKLVLGNGATVYVGGTTSVGPIQGKGTIDITGGSILSSAGFNAVAVPAVYLNNGILQFQSQNSATQFYIQAGGATFDTSPYNNALSNTVSSAILHDPTAGAPAIDGGLTVTGQNVIFSGANTYTGPTRVTAGSSLSVGATNSFQYTTLTTSATGGTFEFGNSRTSNYNPYSFNLGGIAGDGNLSLVQYNDPTNTTVSFTVGGDNQNTTFSGVLGGLGVLSKAGTGNLILTNANTFQNAFTITSGGIGIGNNLALSNVTVNVSGTSGAIFAAGADRTIANNFSIPAGSNLNIVPDPAGLHTLSLTGSFTGSGSVTLAGGTLQTTNEASLRNTSILFDSGTLAYNTSGILSKSYSLSNATLFADGGSTQTIMGFIVAGRLAGDGSFVLGNGALVTGTHVNTGLPVAQTTGTASISDVTFEGTSTLTQSVGAVLNSTGLLVTAPGTTITAGGTINTAGGLITGQLTIPANGLVANSTAPLYLNGSPATTINPGGSLTTAAGSTIEINGGLLINNGTQSGVLNVQLGGVVKGSGTFGTVNVSDGGQFSPGNSPGTATVTNTTFGPGGSYRFEINSADATPGNGADFLNILNVLDITAGDTGATQFTIDPATLDSADQSGALADFNPSRPDSFTLLTAAGGIVGFDPSEFAVNTSAFGNSFTGSFAVDLSGNSLILDYTPTAVPEPGSACLIALGTGLLTRRRSRRMPR